MNTEMMKQDPKKLAKDIVNNNKVANKKLSDYDKGTYKTPAKAEVMRKSRG